MSQKLSKFYDFNSRTLEAERQADFCELEAGQPGLQSKFQDSQNCLRNSASKNTKINQSINQPINQFI
jgi:predicted transglutaminase-like cysteine proteinase